MRSLKKVAVIGCVLKAGENGRCDELGFGISVKDQILYSILIAYEDGSRELKEGLDQSEMQQYLPFIAL